jgi:DNA polymerase III epsilon subunit-like protein
VSFSLPPVFFDCEASSLDGYIIEIGWAFVDNDGENIVSAAHLIRPAPEWKIKDAWSAKSERLHGISLAHLREHSRPVEEIAQIMNRELAGRELVSDNWRYDERWLLQVFVAAGVEPAFTIRHTDARILLEQAAADRNFDLARLNRAREEAERNRRHRADADALIWAELWRMVTKGR